MGDPRAPQSLGYRVRSSWRAGKEVAGSPGPVWPGHRASWDVGRILSRLHPAVGIRDKEAGGEGAVGTWNGSP